MDYEPQGLRRSMSTPNALAHALYYDEDPPLNGDAYGMSSVETLTPSTSAALTTAFSPYVFESEPMSAMPTSVSHPDLSAFGNGGGTRMDRSHTLSCIDSELLATPQQQVNATPISSVSRARKSSISNNLFSTPAQMYSSFASYASANNYSDNEDEIGLLTPSSTMSSSGSRSLSLSCTHALQHAAPPQHLQLPASAAHFAAPATPQSQPHLVRHTSVPMTHSFSDLSTYASQSTPVAPVRSHPASGNPFYSPPACLGADKATSPHSSPGSKSLFPPSPILSSEDHQKLSQAQAAANYALQLSQDTVYAQYAQPTTPFRQVRRAGPGRLPKSAETKPHRCKMCGKSFRRLEHLKRHAKIHTEERPYQCDVQGCERRFSRSDNLRAHRRTHTKRGGRNAYIDGLIV
ncbi:hypothetical protein TRVA0_017S00122 [Trichomonascus vanleenenianus]|uniref:C2H2-type zinc finger protein n=1 Tax=Trichomonascus vanleenenianus TaxID=2268995 RepID=UPI003EC956E7